MGSYVDQVIRKYFDDDEWHSMSDYEKEARMKQKENYEALVNLKLDPKMPFFMEKFEKRLKDEATKKSKPSPPLVNDDHLFKTPFPPKRFRLRRDVESSKPQKRQITDAPEKETGSWVDLLGLKDTSTDKTSEDSCEDMSCDEAKDSTPKASDQNGTQTKFEQKFETFLKDPASTWSIINSCEFQEEDSQDSPTVVLENEKSLLSNEQNRSLNDEEIAEMIQNVDKFKLFLEETGNSAERGKPSKTSSQASSTPEVEETSKRRYPRRSVAPKNYTEPEIPDEDMFVYCDFCENVHEGLCPRHKDIVHVKDKEAPKNRRDGLRALKTIPQGLTVTVSSIPAAGDGVWSTETIMKGTLFGPYDGVFRKNCEVAANDYSWEIKKEKKPVGFIDGKDMTQSNWMRFVNCARSSSEQNLIAYQYNGKIYYRAFEDIPPNRELLVYYGEKFGKRLGISDFKVPKQLSGSVFLCPHCKIGFSSPFYVQRHAKFCRKAFQKSDDKENIGRMGSTLSPGSEHRTFKVCVVCKKNIILSSETAPNLKVKCDNCMFHSDFLDINATKRNKTEVRSEKRFACLHCSATFINNAHMETHIRIHTGEKPFVCNHPDCSATLTQVSHLNKHIKTHTEEKPYVCRDPGCSTSFTQSGDLERHMSTHTGEKPFACSHPGCSARFSLNGDLKTHIRTHTGEKPYACSHPGCSARFNRIDKLKRHIKTHTGEKPYACSHPGCSARFNQISHLKRHIRTHTGEKPYACSHPGCSARFSRNGHLETHIKTHTGEKPYACSHPGCSARFSRNGHLETHIKTHTGEKPYACSHPGCSAIFSRNGHLETHIKTHTGEKPYACSHPGCSARFNRIGNLKRHIRTHTGEKPYACSHPGCSARFSDSSALLRHKRMHE